MSTRLHSLVAVAVMFAVAGPASAQALRGPHAADDLVRAADLVLAADEPARDLNFTIYNMGDLEIQEIYSWPCEDRSARRRLPMSRQSFPEGVVSPGQSIVYALEVGCHNIQIVSLEGFEMYQSVLIAWDDVYEWQVYYSYDLN